MTRLEVHTDAELVVVASPRSGSYRDVALLAGAGAAWACLVFVLFSPWSFSGTWLPLELPLIGAATAWMVHRSPRLLRLLSSQERLHRQVSLAAAEAFHTEAVHGTRGRTGVLVYLSGLEDRVVIVPDAGIEAVVPGATWNDLRWGDGSDPAAPHDLEHFLSGLDQVGAVLAAAVPATDDNPDEISNAPRLRT